MDQHVTEHDMNARDEVPSGSAPETPAPSRHAGKKTAAKAGRPTVRIRSRVLDFTEESMKGFSILSDSGETDVQKRIKTVRDALKTIEKESKEVQSAFFRAVYHSLASYSSESKRYDEKAAKAVDPAEFFALSRISKRKLAVFLMREEAGRNYDQLPDDRKAALAESGIGRAAYVRSQVRVLHSRLGEFPADAVSQISSAVGMSDASLRFHEAFFAENNFFDSLDTLQEDYGIDPSMLQDLAETYPQLGINQSRLRRLIGQSESEMTKNLAANLLSAGLSAATREKAAEIVGLDLKEVEANGFINPNWFLYDITTYAGIELYGEFKTKYVFGKYFLDAVRSIDRRHGLGLAEPSFYNLCQFRLRKNGPDGKPVTGDGGKSELVDIAHHVLEWSVPKDFSSAQLKALVAALREAVPDLQASSGRPKDFVHPVKTVPGRQSYVGFFSGAKDFENTHVVLLSPAEKGQEKRLRLSTDLGQDQFLYLVTQISRFVAKGDVLDPRQLWTLVYRTYNALSTENVSTFDVSVFKQQYREFVKQVIWPLSTQYYDRFGHAGKSRHTVLAGLYGTGKSQFLLNLLAKKDFDFEGTSLRLNANTVNMGILDLVDILSKNASAFKKRLSDIHENTKLPIILIIEDIETIINEEGGKSDVITQALTNFFEGVGSIPVTVVTTTNYPERLSERLVRPNRIDCVIRFDVPLPEEVVKSALRTHFVRNGLEKVFEKAGIPYAEFEAEYVPRMRDFTTSHIGAFAESVKHDVDFESSVNPDFAIDRKRVDEIFASLLLPAEDVKSRQKIIKEWHERLLDRKGKAAIGFHSGK